MKTKILKKMLAITLVCILMVMSMGAYGKTEVYGAEEQSFVPENYHHFTFDTAKQRTYFDEEETLSIDSVIHYVKSLNLEAVGFKHVEEACLAELESYKANGVKLESYTVLVPKTRAMNYYGTYGADKFYYDTTSISYIDYRETDAFTKTSTNEKILQNWIGGIVELVVGIVAGPYAIPFSLLKATLTGINSAADIKVSEGFYYVERFTDVVTTTIYKQMTTGFAPGFAYQDCIYTVDLCAKISSLIWHEPTKHIKQVFSGPHSTKISDKNTVMREAIRSIYQGTVMVIDMYSIPAPGTTWKTTN